MKYGLPVSASLHVIALVAALVALPGGEPLVVQEDALPVDLMTPQEFSQITKGEKSAKPQDKPKTQADKQDPPKPTPENPSQQVANHDATEPQPTPPQPQPKPPEIDRAAEEAKAQAAKEETQRQAEARQAAAQAAQQKAQEKAALEQAAKDQAAKDEARKLEDMARQAAAEEAKQKAADKAAAESQAKAAQEKAAAEKAAQAKAAAEKAAADKAAQAKALAEKAAAQKATQQHLASVEDLLNKDKPARTVQSDDEVSPTASLGKQDANAPKLSISERAALMAALKEHVNNCWQRPPSSADAGAVAADIEFQNNPDGTLAGEPRVIKYVNTPAGIAVANAALRAVKRCITAENPLKLPPNLYKYWAQAQVDFDPLKP